MLKVSSQRLWIGDWIFLKLSQVSLISDWINWKVSQGSWIGDWIILNVSQRSWIGDWIFLKLSQISWISDWIFLKLSQRSWIGDWIILKVQQRSEIGEYQNVFLDVEIQVYVDLWRRDVHVWLSDHNWNTKVGLITSWWTRGPEWAKSSRRGSASSRASWTGSRTPPSC